MTRPPAPPSSKPRAVAGMMSPGPQGTATGRPPRRYRWWHAAVVFVAANVASSLPAGYNGDEEYFEQLPTPPGSPPGWVFAPAWAAINICTLAANLRVANLPPGTPGRTPALAYEAASWGAFAAFSGLYFGLRSPTLGAADTVLGLATTASSVRATARVDRAATWLIAPRLMWLTYASYVSVGTAILHRRQTRRALPRPSNDQQTT